MAFSADTCCCGPCTMHVKKGAFVIAVLGLVLNILSAILSFTRGQGVVINPVFSGILALLHALIYVSIIVAMRKENHRLFWPYLIVGGVLMVSYLIMLFVAVGITIAAPQSMIDELNKHIPDPKLHFDVATFRLLAAYITFIYTITLSISVWFYSVVYRAYKFVKEEAFGSPSGAGAYPNV